MRGRSGRSGRDGRGGRSRRDGRSGRGGRAGGIPRGAALAAALLLTGTACTGGAAAPAGKPGAAGAGDALFPRLGNGGYDVTHYGLTLDYTPETNRLKGTAVITARATQDLSRFNLDLTGLTVRGATVDGARAEVTRRGDELTVTPERSLARGRTFKATLRYDGVPKKLTDADGTDNGWIETDDGAAALGEPGGSMAWFPGNHHPSDKAAYDIAVTVPDRGYTAVANGKLQSQADSKGRRTFRWHSPEPMASYLASVVVGDFTVVTKETGKGVPVYIALDPDEAEDAEGIEELVPEVLDWAAERFGPYPFSATGAVVDHLPGLGYALETQTKPYFEAAPEDTLVVHELAHQWFGNSVTPRAWKDMWLNEGFATYAEWLWDEDRGGRTAQQAFEDFYAEKDPESKGVWDFPPAAPPSAAQVSDPPVYGRGAMALHQLREEVGDDTFFAILKEWTRLHRHGNADTRQFTRLCEQRSGKDLTALFDTWLYGPRKPEL